MKIDEQLLCTVSDEVLDSLEIAFRCLLRESKRCDNNSLLALGQSITTIGLQYDLNEIVEEQRKRNKLARLRCELAKAI